MMDFTPAELQKKDLQQYSEACITKKNIITKGK
jgi:hypothetical protein